MVYLIHLSEPYKHAQHYLGFTEDEESVEDRLSRHRSGAGSKLLRAVNKAGIKYFVARLWPGYTRTQERQLKNQKKARMLCPVCNPKIQVNDKLQNK